MLHAASYLCTHEVDIGCVGGICLLVCIFICIVCIAVCVCACFAYILRKSVITNLLSLIRNFSSHQSIYALCKHIDVYFINASRQIWYKHIFKLIYIRVYLAVFWKYFVVFRLLNTPLTTHSSSQTFSYLNF